MTECDGGVTQEDAKVLLGDDGHCCNCFQRTSANHVLLQYY